MRWRSPRATSHLPSRRLDTAALGALATLPLPALALPDNPEFDRAIVADGLRAMCLTTARIDGSFRTRARLPAGPIVIDAAACAITAPRPDELAPAPRYWLPPAVASRILRCRAGYELRLSSLAAIAAAAAAICDASAGIECSDFVLA